MNSVQKKIIGISGALLVIALSHVPAGAIASNSKIYSAEELIRILTEKTPDQKKTGTDAEFTRGIGGIREGAGDPESPLQSASNSAAAAPSPTDASSISSRAIGAQQFGDLFEADSHNLKAESYRQLDEVGRALHAIISDDPSARFTIQGHTNNTGREQIDVDFSRNMAIAVKNYLVGKLMVDDRRIEVIGYGAKKPVAANDSAHGRMANRRIELVGN